jgi:hypothetical protein
MEGGRLACAFVFASSPFSAIEDYSGAASAINTDLIYNFGAVAVLVFVAGLVSYNSQARGITAGRAFAAMVAGTYVVSAMVWLHHGTPATGTSVIGFSECLYIAGVAAYGAYASVRRGGLGMNVLTAVTELAALGLISWYGTRMYVIGNQSVAYHMVGAAVFLWVALVPALYGMMRTREKPTAALQPGCFV